MSITIIANSDRLREAARRYADETGDDVAAVERATQRWLQETVDALVEEAEFYVHSLNSGTFSKYLQEEVRGG